MSEEKEEDLSFLLKYTDKQLTKYVKKKYNMSESSAKNYIKAFRSVSGTKTKRRKKTK
jgi:succinate dehydrogenase flavin-adding protein (antitoxin of CptAB toxin-antitoxin module)|tara:strand:- start:428 stop:601 length:174 start_codon:yes stop_codon:yes gene_type:complete